MKQLLFASILLVVPGFAEVNVPLTVQEAIYPGSVAGVARTLDPVTVGVPLPDDESTGTADLNRLTLSGATVGQFRVLGRWPSGRIKWVLVDTQASLAAGQANTGIALRDGGSGNFGGPDLATDDGATITVNTGTATFTIRKARFNVLDRVVVGDRTLVTSGSSEGLVVNGPPPGQTTCPPCTTVYSSANDPNSTAVIEENGPAKAVIKATGRHVDASGFAYLQFTVRMYFYKDKSWLKITSILRNAEYGKSNTFATAYKGHQGYEIRVRPSLGGPLSYAIANHTSSPTTGTVSGSESVYLFQGDSDLMKDTRNGCGYGCVPYTTDPGYRLVANGGVVMSGSKTEYPEGWADIRDASGAGLQIGVYQMAAYGPKSLEFNAGGTDVRIGIFARQNGKPIYQAWPQWSIYDAFLNFHSSALASPADEFLKFQHYLTGRAHFTHYNQARVFPYPLVDPQVEDDYYKGLAKTANPAVSASRACCLQDLGTADTYNNPLYATMAYNWSAGGGGNQSEFRWSYLLNFLTRGMTGRYLLAAHFYRFQAALAWAHSDGFDWRDRPGFGSVSPPAELDGFGFPNAQSANSSLSFRNWVDQEHGHWYGMPDFYFMSGDETIRDAMLDGTKDWYLNNQTYQSGMSRGLWNTRAVGIQLMGAARFATFLASIGDPDAQGVLAQARNSFNIQVKPDLCMSGFPEGCSFGPVGGPWTVQGISRTRGVHHTARGGIAKLCGASGVWRANGPFQTSILAQGIWELREAMGPQWQDYGLALDLAYGLSEWTLTEGFGWDGTNQWKTNGFRYYMALDAPNGCDTQYFPVRDNQTVWFPFWLKHAVTGKTDWEPQFRLAMQRLIAATGMRTAEFGQYNIGAVIERAVNPGTAVLTDVPITGVVDNGGGSYTISWTAPENAQSYRIKWGPKRIVDWIGFDPATNTFTGDPANTMNWFAATDAANVPAPGTPGQTQSITIATGLSGLKAANFSVRAWVGGEPGQGGPVVPTGSLTLVSGDGQTGSPGQALPNPLIVRVTDPEGKPKPGVAVTFAITAGGGSLSPAQASTDKDGFAFTILTLGPEAGANQVVASAGTLAGSPVIFTANATVETGTEANLILVSGDHQTGRVGQPLAAPFVVRVTDANGRPVSGVSVSFTLSAGGGALEPPVAATDSEGRAATRLTLGPVAGTHTVLASSGTLVGSPITFTATAIDGDLPTGITWKKPAAAANWPGYNGYLSIHYDPVSQQTILYGVTGGSKSIYSTDLYFYNAAANTWTRLPGTGSKTSICHPGSDTWPADRHPIWHMAVDTKRNVLWLHGGVCGGDDLYDTWYLKLNPNPLDNTWHKVPTTQSRPYYMAATIYDPENDVLFSYGYDGRAGTRNNWVFCSTMGNPTPGVPTAEQSAAGCVVPDDWNEVQVAGGVQPPGSMFPAMVYDPVTKKAILFGGWQGYKGIRQNQVWAYDVPTRTWTQKALSTTPPPMDASAYIPLPALAYNSATNKIIYHQTGSTPADWEYDPVADTWTRLPSQGVGATRPQAMTYDAAHNALIGFNQGTSSTKSEVWVGMLSTSGGAPANPCDLNGSGGVDALDVQLAIHQILGVTQCGSADLNKDGKCTVVDLQRVVKSSLGGSCQAEP